METAPITSWTLVQEIPIPHDVNEMLIDGEQAVAACRRKVHIRRLDHLIAWAVLKG